MTEKIEVPKELADKIYKLVESVRIDGKLRKGANEVTKSIEKTEARFVIIASDVKPEEIIMHLPVISKERGIPFVHVPSRAELGAAAGLPVGTAAIAIVNAGEAKTQLAGILHEIELLQKGQVKAVEAKAEHKPAEHKPAEVKVEHKPAEPKAEHKPVEHKLSEPKQAKRERPEKKQESEAKKAE